MTNFRSLIESAESRAEESRRELVAAVNGVQSKVRKVRSSPLVIGGIIAGTGFAGYLALRRKRNSRDATETLRESSNFTKALKTAQVLMSVISAMNTISARHPKPKLVELTDPRVAPVVPCAESNTNTVLVKSTWVAQQIQMAKAAGTAWIDDYAPSMGAALSYYTLFSLAPLLIIVIAVAGMVFGQDAAQGQIVAQLGGLIGNDGAAAIENILRAAREPTHGVIATLVGVVVLLVGATAIFAELQSALDRIWRVPAPAKGSGIWQLLRTRLLSFGMVLGLGFLLIVSLVVSAILAALGNWWSGWFAGWDVVLEIFNFTVSFGIFTLLFAMIYKIMPSVKISWRDVWTGATVTALLFSVGKVLIGIYLGKSGMASAFGAAGSLVVLIAWVYYSAQIFLLGAEYTWVYANQLGSRSKKLS